MKLVIFGLFGVALLLVNIWFVRRVYFTFFDNDVADVIAPAQFVGMEDKDGVRGKAMALMLSARITALQREQNDAEYALRDAFAPVFPVPRLESGLPARVDPPRITVLSTRFIGFPKLELKVSGVDVSGLVTWVYQG